MGALVDYDEHDRKGRGQCGDPFAPIAAFFRDSPRTRADVLDLGWGQGRDALLAARHGHAVVGVDLSEIGSPTVGRAAPDGDEVYTLLRDDHAHIVRVIPIPDEIRLLVRPLTCPLPPEPMAIPDAGLWRLPEPLPPWQPPKLTYREFPDGLDCPRCGASSTSYRSLSDGDLVCSTCGRSFEP